MDGRISVVSVPVSDQDQAKLFYTQVLGFSSVVDRTFDANGEDQRWVMLAPPGGGTAITLVTWFETMPPGSLKGMVMSVPDIEQAVQHLTNCGVAGASEPIQQAPWGRWIVIEDPDGNSWVVQQDIVPPV